MPAANTASSALNRTGAAQRAVRGMTRRTLESAPSGLQLELLRCGSDLFARQEPGATASLVEEGDRLAIGGPERREHEGSGDDGARATDERLAGHIHHVEHACADPGAGSGRGRVANVHRFGLHRLQGGERRRRRRRRLCPDRQRHERSRRHQDDGDRGYPFANAHCCPPRDSSKNQRHYSRGPVAAPIACPIAGKVGSRTRRDGCYHSSRGSPDPDLPTHAKEAHMKLVRYSQNGQPPRLGTLVGAERVMDLESSAAAYLASRGVVRAGAIAAALFPHGSTRGFLEGGSASQDMLAAMTDAATRGT